MACLCDERVGAAVFDESNSLLDATGTRLGRGADAAAVQFESDIGNGEVGQRARTEGSLQLRRASNK